VRPRRLDGRTGRRQQVHAVPQQQLAVGAHIDDQPDLIGRSLIRPLRQHDGHVIRADMPCLYRQHVGLRAGREL